MRVVYLDTFRNKPSSVPPAPELTSLPAASFAGPSPSQEDELRTGNFIESTWGKTKLAWELAYNILKGFVVPVAGTGNSLGSSFDEDDQQVLQGAKRRLLHTLAWLSRSLSGGCGNGDDGLGGHVQQTPKPRRKLRRRGENTKGEEEASRRGREDVMCGHEDISQGQGDGRGEN